MIGGKQTIYYYPLLPLPPRMASGYSV